MFYQDLFNNPTISQDITTLRTLYCGLIKPFLEYSCETWNINRLESVQRRATKFILKSKDDYYTSLNK